MEGEIEERAAGEYDHATWQYALLRWFTAHEEEWDLRVRSELQVKVSPTRYRVPDLTVIARPLPEEQVITRAPLAVFEILSPEDRMDRLLRKLGDYEGWASSPSFWSSQKTVRRLATRTGASFGIYRGSSTAAAATWIGR